MDVSKNRGEPPKWMAKIMEPPIKMIWMILGKPIIFEKHLYKFLPSIKDSQVCCDPLTMFHGGLAPITVLAAKTSGAGPTVHRNEAQQKWCPGWNQPGEEFFNHPKTC